jgi:hypothetical protein
VAELAADEDDIQPVGNQQRGEDVASEWRVSLPSACSPALDGLPEAFADVAVVEPAPERVRKDEVARLRI